MTSFKNYVTANIQGLVVRALDQFCQDRGSFCRAIDGTPETAFSGAVIDNEDALIPFVADDHKFTLQCHAEGDQASCNLYQGTIPFAQLFGVTSGSVSWHCDTRSNALLDTKIVVVADCSTPDGGSQSDATDVKPSPADADASKSDAGPKQTDAGPDVVDAAAVDIAQDVTPTQEEVVPETTTDTGPDAGPDAAGLDVAMEVAEEVSVTQDAGPEVVDDVPVPVEDVADAASLPDAVSEDAGVVDAAVEDVAAEDLAPDIVPPDAGLPEEVTSTPGIWGPTPNGQPFCTVDAPFYNTLSGDPAVFSAMCVYADTVDIFIPKGANDKPEFKFGVPFTPDVFAVDFENGADVSQKQSMLIYVTFNALLPSVPVSPDLIEPHFAIGKDPLLLQLYKDGLITGDAIWYGQDNVGHDVSVTYHPATPGYVELTYLKGQGLFGKYSFPCAYPKATPPLEMTECPKKVAP